MTVEEGCTGARTLRASLPGTQLSAGCDSPSSLHPSPLHFLQGQTACSWRTSGHPPVPSFPSSCHSLASGNSRPLPGLAHHPSSLPTPSAWGWYFSTSCVSPFLPVGRKHVLFIFLTSMPSTLPSN